ncbi:MAG: IPT/TIG domain-containing protein [Candidatus Acidiferrales bacterium]
MATTSGRIAGMHLVFRVLLLLIVFGFGGLSWAQGPSISSLSPTSGPVGIPVTITGANFGASQGTSTVSLNGTNAVATTWSATTIVAMVPSGASSGPFSVTVNGQGANSSSFTITPLPSGWSDGDVGSVGIAGSATYANGVFTVKGSGTGITGTADEMNFAYQSLSGNGTIVARVVSVQGGSNLQAGVMIRETLNANATNAYSHYRSSYIYFYDRATTGASTTVQAYLSATLPYWVEVVRSGNTFSSYMSLNGLYWTQLGSTQTITMAQNVYIGLAVSSESNSSLATATIDNVSISSSASPAPVITSVSPPAAAIGSQAVISGSGFGASQGSSLVTLNDVSMTINAWSATSITVTIPSGAASGPLVVLVAPTMNASNPIVFLIGTQPLPSWLDVDIGTVGMAGSASYANGVFTVKGSGSGVTGAADSMHFVYEPLSGDGSIVARVVNVQSTAGFQAGVMIRETLSPSATMADTDYNNNGYAYFHYRLTTGGNASSTTLSTTLPRWLKVVRSGNSFSGYASADGMNWTQIGSTQTITMAQNVYIGLVTSAINNTALATATFDNVSISSSASPAPVITGVSPAAGAVGSQAVISGSGFGASQNGSGVMLNGMQVTVNSWSNTSITITVPSGSTSGILVVSVAPSMNDSNPFSFLVGTQPLPSWLDVDIGSVGSAGSASFSNGVFTVEGSGTGIWGTADGMNFLYQALSGDGTIVARVVSVQGGSSPEAGVMIRETLNANSTNAYVFYTKGTYQYLYFNDRPSTGANTSSPGGPASGFLPSWVKLVRSGNAFSAYYSSDGVIWTQLGSTQTITMAQNVYVGLAVSSYSNSSLATATFDNVSINSSASPAPVITSVSPPGGLVGTQAVISGSGFGSAQSGGAVTLNGVPVTVNTWSATSITTTIPSGAASGPLAVLVAPTMNASNPIVFLIGTQPLPSWLDVDIGSVGLAGSATYASGRFTVQGSGRDISGTADGLNFVYVPLSGDGTIAARVINLSSPSMLAGVMIRETLSAGSKNAYTYYVSPDFYLYYRPSTGGSTSSQGTVFGTLPNWVKLVRSGNNFSGYASPDGVNWTQIGSAQTITMAQNVSIGLAVSSDSNSSLAAAIFDNVSVTSTLASPVITSLTPSNGVAGISVTIAGSNFGAIRGNNVVQFNGVTATISSWSDTSIVATVPNPATTGPVVVTVNGQSSNGVIFTAITTGTLSGTITSSGSGMAISRAQIQLRQLGEMKATTQSDSNGNYEFLSLIAGTYDIQVSASGFGASLNSAISVPAGVTTTLNVSLSAPGTVSGTVTRANGVTPIPGATVQAFVGEASAAPVTTDSNGNYSIAGLNTGNYNVQALANGYVASTQSESVTGNSTTTANFSLQAHGTGAGTISYVYDALGRLVGVINPNGDTAVYNYDAVGNLASISRQSSNQLSIITFGPASGAPGATVTIYGTAFSSTASQNTVTFNGTAATVQSATATQLVVTVPMGATTGPISVNTSAGTATSSASYTVKNQ